MTGVRPALKNALVHRLMNAKGFLSERLRIAARASEVERYQTMKRDNDSGAEVFRAGEFWAFINREYSKLIWAGALDNVRNEFFNRRFAAHAPTSRELYRALLFMLREKIAARAPDGFLDVEGEPSAGGNLDQEVVRGNRVSLDFLQSVEEMFAVREAWAMAGREGSPRVIVELGAGYGRVAYVARRMLPDCTYVILDLPEALMCSSSWLKQVLPDDVVPYEESRSVTRFTREHLLSRRVWTLGSQQIRDLDADVADAFVNIYSFAEMPRASIDNYFQHASRITNGVMFSKQRRVELNTHDKERNDMEAYRVPEGWKELFRRDASLYEDFFEAAWATR